MCSVEAGGLSGSRRSERTPAAAVNHSPFTVCSPAAHLFKHLNPLSTCLPLCLSVLSSNNLKSALIQILIFSHVLGGVVCMTHL